MTDMLALVTGASGFVGRNLCRELHLRNWRTREVVRNRKQCTSGAEIFCIDNFDGNTTWGDALHGVDVVFHLAARAHLLRDTAPNPAAAFREINLEGTVRLARQAAIAGVKRFLFVSSIGVNGSHTSAGQAFSDQHTPRPHNAYAHSKWEAEKALTAIALETGLEVVVVRPPLVYGPNAPGNFAQLLNILDRRIPLPLASIHNQRDLIYLGNLVDALILCATHPKAANQTYLVRDGEPVSTPELLRRLGEAMGKPARLFPCPVGLLELAGKLTGKSAQIERLVGSLQIDDAKIRNELGWRPPFTLQEGLRATVAGY